MVKPILEDTVKLLVSNISSERCWKVADLGCSSGPNSLFFVSNMLSVMDNVSMSLNQDTPRVLQIYMNDLFGNDFNCIFKLIPDFFQRIRGQKKDNHVRCFIHATPGSFYGRLFPDDYIHFFHSSYSLHWLSQGLVERAKLDFFDLPIYGPTPEEVRQVIEEEGSFRLKTLKTVKIGWDGNLQEDVDDATVDSKTRALIVAKSIRAVFEPLLSANFGEVIMDELFSRFAMIVAKLIDTEFESLEYTNVIVSMTKDS
ncbi:7-methylxanthosine synthase [Vigna angularis]|uniref:7-methylxanthosine synthase n=1 Tax=Phaseolus angularis TaxID=3914 RepID=A0A8T0JRP7_PHAAN|nr:7-methylxanthosine synthase [Vigna angularis]